MSDPTLKSRVLADYPFQQTYRTRWSDNDVYAHMNNSIYYHLFDSIVNAYLAAHCAHRPTASPAIGLVVHSRCTYLAPVGFPALLRLGLRVARLGASSVEYEIGVFEEREGEAEAERAEEGDAKAEPEVRAVGGFVHVFVERDARRPATGGMGEALRRGLRAIQTEVPRREKGKL